MTDPTTEIKDNPVTASLLMAAVLACAQFGPLIPRVPGPVQGRDEAPPEVAASRITAVTIYQGQALVTREVSVPEGEGALELVVAPLPAQAVEGSLFTEGSDGLQVLSTRTRSRVVKDDSRKDVHEAEKKLKSLQEEALRIQRELDVQGEDLQYLHKLEGYTAAALSALTAKERLDSKAVLTLSKFVMDGRGSKARSEVALRRELRENTEAVEFARRRLAELSAGPARIERGAVIVVQKTRKGPGTVRLGYLAGGATWSPQYRIKGTADDAPVRLDYLAPVVQQTGEAWPAVRVTLSTARPTQDSAPPELLPLKMTSAEAPDPGPVEAHDDRSRRVAAELDKVIEMSFANETPLADVLKYVRLATKSQNYPDGIPIYVDPVGLQEAEKTKDSPVIIDLAQVPLRTSLKLALEQLGLTYKVTDGLLKVVSVQSEDVMPGGGFDARPDDSRGDAGRPLEADRGESPEVLNEAAAGDQAEELRVSEGTGSGPSAPERDHPSVSFAVAGALDVPSRPDPLMLEIARVEMPAAYYAKAVPVLTPRVFRLAKLTNKSELVLLPGEATVHVGGEFVGRMRLPLVAAGEPFLAGFGVDPQLQVSRRLLKKARTVQGGNQVFTYEFRIGLRNFRPGPVRVELWDRLPKPQGEAVAVNLVKTSAELSADPMYNRTARMDNLLRWDLDLPRGAVGEKTMYLNYESRLEYARDLPPPRFNTGGGLREGPIGGGAMGGGMGGMGGGFRSVEPGGH